MFKRTVGELLTNGPATIPAEAGLRDVVAHMRQNPVSALLVTGQDKVLGVVTERDLLAATLAEDDPASPVAGRMTRSIRSIPRTHAVTEACRAMTEFAVRHLVVTGSAGEVLGLVDESDLVEALAIEFMVENVECGEIMNRQPLLFDPEAVLREVLRAMVDTRSACAVVVEDRRPLGVLTERDVAWRVLGVPGAMAADLESFMSRPAVIIPADAMVYKVILYMRQKRLRRVVAVDERGRVAGLLSEEDIIRQARRFA